MGVIAVGGFQHETNTFAPSKADYAAFEHGGGWPPLVRGADIAPRVAGANIPAAGAIDALHALGHRTIGLVWGAASPSAHVTRDAYERIAGDMLARLAAAGPVDGVYLDLHGAMVTEHLDDGEGELLGRVRRIVGPRTPVVASLDLHANVTNAMIERCEGLVAYRSYPHVDMAATGERAARLLDRTLAAGHAPAKSFHPIDFLTGLPSQCTLIEPARGLYGELEALERSHDTALSFAPGFPMADFPECGMSVFGYGDDQARVAGAATALAHAVADAEGDFSMRLFEPDEAVARAMQRGAPGAPVVLADTQDNPGAGGNGDTTGLLSALLKRRAPGAVFGLLIDPASAAQAHAIGAGRRAVFALGEISGVPGHVPLGGEFTVLALGDGRFTCTGPMFSGFRMDLGPMALLVKDGVRVVLASRKCQAADQQMFRHVGIEPVRERILALKSSVHFRADFEPFATEVLVVVAPGPAKADPTMFSWRRLRPGLRLKPLGPAFRPA
ncbi:MAG TPA: M81 family metallopeptidase [Casimicrobiaceae bacterium]|nr:M81 family metallopeptidase [Casimicrobiaceae bacterium]